MQISGHYSSSFGSEIEDSGVRHGAPREPDLSMKSSYDSSTEIGRPKLQSRNSISLKAQAVASGFVGCFVPRSCITGNDADREVGMPDTSDYSSTSYHPIIHRDVKASNILLTEKLRAKVADFGFARLAEEDPEKTHISTQIKGTAGYLDPEYLRTYQLTEKSDVYSFGVLLVEMISGRRPIERNRASRERMTTRWAIRRFKEGGVATAMDPRVRRNPASVGAAERVLGLAERCLAEERKSRPAMKECAEVLWGIRRDYQLMLKPRTVTASAPSSSLTAIEEREEVSGSGEYKSAKKMA